MFSNQMAAREAKRNNLSIRQAMIYVSEIIIKPRLGFGLFCRARMEFIGITIFFSTCINLTAFSLRTIAQHHSMEDQMN